MHTAVLCLSVRDTPASVCADSGCVHAVLTSLRAISAVMHASGRPAAPLCCPLLQAESTLKVVVRTAVPLTDTLAAQQQAAPRPYGRAVFCMAYADTEVLHRISTFPSMCLCQ